MKCTSGVVALLFALVIVACTSIYPTDTVSEQSADGAAAPSSTPTATLETEANLYPPIPDHRQIYRADASEDIWRALQQRPLRLPELAPGEHCPVSHVSMFRDATMVGFGPIYPTGVFTTDGLLRYGSGSSVDDWRLMKVPWVSNDDYHGPALIRGRQLDGPNELRFAGDGDVTGPVAELRFPIATNAYASNLPEGWRFQPSAVGFRAPGCYAFQIDGINFTRMIVFRASAEPFVPIVESTPTSASGATAVPGRP